MLNRAHRFHGYGSLNSVYRNGQTARGLLVSLRYTTRSDPKRPYRVAVVVSRKVSKSAVVRNRIRRRLYEAVRCHAQAIAIPPGTDLIFTVFTDQVATLEAVQLQAALADLLKKATPQV